MGSCQRSTMQGLSLIELVVAISISAILATLAFANYSAGVTKSRRNAAEACLAQYSAYMAHYYSLYFRYDQDNNGKANSLPPIACASQDQTGRWYQYSLPINSLKRSSYSLIATPLGSQATADKQCGILGLDNIGKRYDGTLVAGGSMACW